MLAGPAKVFYVDEILTGLGLKEGPQEAACKVSWQDYVNDTFITIFIIWKDSTAGNSFHDRLKSL